MLRQRCFWLSKLVPSNQRSAIECTTTKSPDSSAGSVSSITGLGLSAFISPVAISRKCPYECIRTAPFLSSRRGRLRSSPWTGNYPAESRTGIRLNSKGRCRWVRGPFWRLFKAPYKLESRRKCRWCWEESTQGWSRNQSASVACFCWGECSQLWYPCEQCAFRANTEESPRSSWTLASPPPPATDAAA